MSEFHFSPRPNRAHEIAWMPWGNEAFARATLLDRPLLLSISAVWCHWCHVMDETSYSDPEVIATINAQFVPVRVDNDERPDVNARYNMGGWPTTAFLTPDGSILTGATYLPPAQMLRALGEISGYYRQNRGQIMERVAEMRMATTAYQLADAGVLVPGLLDTYTSNVAATYDLEYGGFGEEPKFPQAELLDFLLTRWRATGDGEFYEIVAHTMRAMSGGGMYDHVEGGYFRYSTTRDWSVPHFEKMTEDHAGLLRVLALLELWTPSADWRRDIERTIGYIERVLLDPETALFAGSQDADEAYFALDAAGRAEREAPFVDRRSYTNWTASLAGSFALCGLATGDERLIAQARATLDALWHRARTPEGGLYHVIAPGEAPRISGLLGDSVAMIRAMLDLHEAAGDASALERARALADETIGRFGAEDGGFYDRLDAETIGRLDRRDRPLPDNGIMAESLLRLAALLHEPRYRDVAERTLRLYAGTFERAHSFAATYARALARYLAPEVTVRIEPPGEHAMRAAARRLPSPFAAVGSAPGLRPRAYVCVGTACAAPVDEPDAIAAAYATLA
jgi:uncharacterized protein YyaL (SSP411 family)